MTYPDLVDISEQIFPFGSKVYGTDWPDSDTDLVAVLKKDIPKKESLANYGDTHIQIYTHDEFVFKIHNHDILALECIFLPKSKLLKFRSLIDYCLYFTLDKTKLRESISTITNNSWTKGKKKLIISGDYDKSAGIKSVFHSMRILDLGIQIARENYCLKYDNVNWIYQELFKLGTEYDADILWEKIDTKFRKTYNAFATEFKSVAPKNLEVRDKQKAVKTILEEYECYDVDMLSEIMNVFKD